MTASAHYLQRPLRWHDANLTVLEATVFYTILTYLEGASARSHHHPNE